MFPRNMFHSLHLCFVAAESMDATHLTLNITENCSST